MEGCRGSSGCIRAYRGDTPYAILAASDRVSERALRRSGLISTADTIITANKIVKPLMPSPLPKVKQKESPTGAIPPHLGRRNKGKQGSKNQPKYASVEDISEPVNGGDADIDIASLDKNEGLLLHLSKEELEVEAPGCSQSALSGVEISGGLAIDSVLYLNGLWEAIRQLDDGAQWIHERWPLDNLDSFASTSHSAPGADDFDGVIVCVGAHVKALSSFPGASSVRLVRGQSVFVENKLNLKSAVLAGQYVVPCLTKNSDELSGSHEARKMLLCGATQEHITYETFCDEDVQAKGTGSNAPPATVANMAGTSSSNAVLTSAVEREILLKKIGVFYPPVLDAAAMGSMTGTRAIRDRGKWGRLPIVGQISDKKSVCYVIGALGARGLIHHAFIARHVAAAVIANDNSLIPYELREGLEEAEIQFKK